MFAVSGIAIAHSVMTEARSVVKPLACTFKKVCTPFMSSMLLANGNLTSVNKSLPKKRTIPTNKKLKKKI